MEDFLHYILHVTGANDVTLEEQIQELWSGYGMIYRLHLSGADFPFAIVKSIEPPIASTHPRGWNTSAGNARKLKSYEVEANWYTNYNHHSSEDFKYANLYGHLQKKNTRLLILEDLSCEGYSIINGRLTEKQMLATLRWLARFHAHFLNVTPKGLWEVGTYWHLATREEELERMQSQQSKENASWIDEKLNSCEFKTIVHGDAKQANFMYKENQVAAFDFQYVGGGCGIKDVIYFLSSTLTGDEIRNQEEMLLTHYFSELRTGLHNKLSEEELGKLEKEWRFLYAFAWADFARFLDGWSPGHYKMNAYVQAIVDKLLKENSKV